MPVDPYYLVYGQAEIIQGDILEVGLGEGNIPRVAMPRNEVVTFTNYERVPAIITDFDTVNSGRDAKHTIHSEDFLLSVRGATYDIAIVDTTEEYTFEVYEEARAIVIEAAQRMKTGGKIIFEYAGDFNLENDFRQFMETQFGPMETEHVKMTTGARMATSRHLAFYRV